MGAATHSQLIALGGAITAHRLPVSLFIFSMISNAYGVKKSWWIMILLAITTVVGFSMGDSTMLNLTTSSFSWLQAFVGGTLLHVIFAHELKHLSYPHSAHLMDKKVIYQDELSGCYHEGHHHEGHHHEGHHHEGHHHEGHHHEGHHHESHHHRQMPDWLHVHHHHNALQLNHRWAIFGALMGMILVVYFILLPHGHEHSHLNHNVHASKSFLNTLVTLSLESAPILFLAYVLAGLLRSFITPTQLRWLGQGRASIQALKGVTFGLPLPICSCGVLPVYETLIRRGVPGTAAIGFLVATPELGLDAILLSIPLLGWEMTIGRLIAAFVVAFFTAIIVGHKLKPHHSLRHSNSTKVSHSFALRLKEGIHFGLVELFDHTFPWVLAGLLAAAWLEPMLDHEVLSGIPSYLQVPIFAFIGIPIYVCASGSTPLAAIAIHQGVGPGAALAFLIAGPATNITTFGIMSKLHGTPVAIIFGIVVALGAIGAGICIDYLALEATLTLHVQTHDEPHFLGWFSIGIIVILFALSLGRQGPRGVMGQITNPIHN